MFLVFSMFSILSMFSELSPCSLIRKGRMAQYVEPCPVDLFVKLHIWRLFHNAVQLASLAVPDKSKRYKPEIFSNLYWGPFSHKSLLDVRNTEQTRG